MLKILSYLNIVLAVSYFLLYLMSSTSYAMIGILAVVVFNLLTIRNAERGIKFTPLHYILGVACLFFAGFLTLWVAHVISSSLEYNYFQNSWLYIFITCTLILSIVFQFILTLKRPVT